MTHNLHHVVISQLPKPSEKLWEHVRSISWTITWTHSRHSTGFLQGLKAPMPHLSVFIRVSGYASAPLSCHAKQSHSLHGRQGWPTPNCDLYPRRRVLSVLFGTRHITAQTNKPIKTKLLQNTKRLISSDGHRPTDTAVLWRQHPRMSCQSSWPLPGPLFALRIVVWTCHRRLYRAIPTCIGSYLVLRVTDELHWMTASLICVTICIDFYRSVLAKLLRATCQCQPTPSVSQELRCARAMFAMSTFPWTKIVKSCRVQVQLLR